MQGSLKNKRCTIPRSHPGEPIHYARSDAMSSVLKHPKIYAHCHTSPLLFLVLDLSPLLPLFFPQLLLNLVLPHCEIYLTAALATNHKSSFGILALFLLQFICLFIVCFSPRNWDWKEIFLLLLIS